MKQLPCEDCKKPNINCDCGLKEEMNIKEVMETALKKYENDKELSKIKITSINQLAALMAGSGTDGHCTYDHEKKIWTPGKFIPSPKGIFDWENINGTGKSNTEFILDSGSQLNLIPMRDLKKQGVDINSLPQINLNVTGVGGEMSAKWYKLKVNVTSRATNQSHFEEFYTSAECKVTLLSYGTLIRLGHINPATFERSPRTQGSRKESPAAVFISKCEETTTYDKQNMRYSCACPERKLLTEEEMVEERKLNKKKLDEIENSLAKGLGGKSDKEISEFIKQQIIDHFKDSVFNTCENQTLNMLRNTEMDVHIRPEATPKRTMKPIPCPWNLREQAKKDLDSGVRLGIIQKVEQGGMQPSWISPAIFV